MARDAQLQETTTSLANLASSLMQHAEDTFDLADAVLVGLAERLDVDGTSPAALARLDRVLAAQVRALPRVREISVHGEDGRWLATSLPAKGGNNIDRDYFTHHRDSLDAELYVGQSIIDRGTGRRTITVSRRLQHADGTFAGVAVAFIDAGYFTGKYGTYALGVDGIIALATTAGSLLARYPAYELAKPQDFARSQLYAELRQRPAATYEYVSVIDGVHRYASYLQSARYPLVVVVAASADQVLDNWRAEARVHIASVGILAVIVGLLGLHLARQMWRRQAAEGQVRTSEARFRLLVENSHDLITLGPRVGAQMEYVSPASVTMLGYEPPEFAVLPPGSVTHPNDYERIAASVASLSAVRPEYRSEHRLRHKAGHWVAVAAVFRLVNPGMADESLVAMVHDVTERIRRDAEREAHTRELEASNQELERMAHHLVLARDQAERASRAKTRFLAGMSHELRTPLNGVLGYAQLLRLEGGLSGTQLGRVDSMLGAGSHLLQMINCVLDLSEIEAEHVTLRMAAVDLRSAAKVCLDLVRSAAEAKQLTLRCVVAPGVPVQVTTDATRLRQVLLNLLGNAVKFTVAGGVDLRMRLIGGGAQDAPTLRIEVADTGPGISAAQRHRLCQDFDRLDVEDTSTVEGTGLGLAISARLAVLLGGRLGHEDNPGGGSVFWLELPAGTVPTLEASLLETPSTAEAAVLLPVAVLEGLPSPRPAARGRTLRVLVADDVPMNRDIVRSFLVAAGHEVVLSENGAEVVAKAAAEMFDVVLMDVRMPLMNGFDAAVRIRGLKGARGQVPIVALTAQSFAGQMEESRKAGMDAHLTKPFTPKALLEAVTHWGIAGRCPRAAHPGIMPAQAAVPAEAVPAARLVDATGPVDLEARPGLKILDTTTFERTAALLAPGAMASYLRSLADQGEALVHSLRAPDALAIHSGSLAEAAHALAGSAGLFGFGQLAAVGLGFEHAVQAGTPDVRSIAGDLTDAVATAVQEIRRRVPANLDA